MPEYPNLVLMLYEWCHIVGRTTREQSWPSEPHMCKFKQSEMQLCQLALSRAAKTLNQSTHQTGQNPSSTDLSAYPTSHAMLSSTSCLRRKRPAPASMQPRKYAASIGGFCVFDARLGCSNAGAHNSFHFGIRVASLARLIGWHRAYYSKSFDKCMLKFRHSCPKQMPCTCQEAFRRIATM